MPQILSNSSFATLALAALAFYAMGTVLYKLWQFRNANLFEHDFIEDSMNAVRRGDRAGAARTLSGVRGPLARIMRISLEAASNRAMLPKHRRAEVLRVGNADLAYLEAHLRGLELVAAVAPLLGLLGTVLNLIIGFHDISIAAEKLSPNVMANSVWQSLPVAAAGLVLSIPTLVSYHLLRGVTERLRKNMQNLSEQILILAEDSKPAEIAAPMAVAEAPVIREDLNQIEVAPVVEPPVPKMSELESMKMLDAAKMLEAAAAQHEAEKPRSESFDAASIRLRATPQMPEAPSMLNPRWGKVNS